MRSGYNWGAVLTVKLICLEWLTGFARSQQLCCFSCGELITLSKAVKPAPRCVGDKSRRKLPCLLRQSKVGFFANISLFAAELGVRCGAVEIKSGVIFAV